MIDRKHRATPPDFCSADPFAQPGFVISTIHSDCATSWLGAGASEHILLPISSSSTPRPGELRLWLERRGPRTIKSGAPGLGSGAQRGEMRPAQRAGRIR